MNLEEQKKHFKNHIATYTDYGNIKILDFKAPGTNFYRIRFMFEEDYCRLHISGDLGELIATNYDNMTYEHFNDFVDNVGYFESKINCHSRPLYVYDMEKARKDIKEYLKARDCINDIICHPKYSSLTNQYAVNVFINDVLCDFSDETGISSSGYETLSKIDHDAWEIRSKIGRESTNILDLYLFAFKLAQERLCNKEEL